LRQDSAHARQAETQSSIPSSVSQLSAHAEQISAQAAQLAVCTSVPVSMICAEARHMSVQEIIRRKCAGWTCPPPCSRQCDIAMPMQVW
jgi:hypothetical protein